MNDEIFNRLNPNQIEAVKYIDSSLLVLSGAGSGKTTVITRKVAYLVKNHNYDLDRILAITFTNKAANEMKTRVVKLLSLNKEPKWITTFHSMCAKILRYDANLLGYKRNFLIYDEKDSEKAIKSAILELGLFLKSYDMGELKRIFSHAKQYANNKSVAAYDTIYPMISTIFSKYNEILKRCNAMDFDDLLLNVVILFSENKDVLNRWVGRFDYVLADEYQDTNKVQHDILKFLVGDSVNVTVTGDPNQTIYSWRGAHPANILNFDKEFDKTKIIKLEQNYRSTSNILRVANCVSALAKGAWKEKILELWTNREAGDEVQAKICQSRQIESEFISHTIKNRRSDFSLKYSDFAILVRMSFFTRYLEESFIKNRIPYQIVGGFKFYHRAEIMDMLGYLRFVCNQQDDQAFFRIINSPTRGMGKSALESIKPLYETNWIYTLRKYIQRSSKKSQAKKLESFINIIETAINMDISKPYDIANFIYDSIEYEQYLKNKYKHDWYDRIENVKELLSVLSTCQSNENTLPQFLQDSMLVSDQDDIEDNESVKIMTIHAAKGLEFPTVFVAGLEEGIFPSARADTFDQMEEERRLFYVAITRAKDLAYLTASTGDLDHGYRSKQSEISRFIEEIRGYIDCKRVNMR